MPYIYWDDRAAIAMHARDPKNAGELNFQLTDLCIDYIKTKGVSYASINEIIGVLQCMQLEFYRRLAAPYEDEKCKENGDVYR